MPWSPDAYHRLEKEMKNTINKIKELKEEKKEIEEKIEYSSSDKIRESLEEELYNINDSIKILFKGMKN